MIWNPEFLLQIVLLVACVAIGATVGSFLNVCIYRIPIGLTVTKPPRSFCPGCGHQVEARDNLPILSWLWLRGKCRHCQFRIPVWYFLIELLSGLGAGLAFWRSGLLGAFLFILFYAFAAYALRTARGGCPIGLKLTAATVVSGLLNLGTRHPVSLLSFFLSLVISVLAAREIISRWSPSTPTKGPNLELVITICALVSGLWAAVAVCVAIILVGRFTKAEEQFPGYQDGLILLGICLGPYFNA